MSKRISFEDVLMEFEKRNYTLLDKEYINNKTKLSYICNQHPDKIQSISLNSLKSGTGCRECGNKLIGKKSRLKKSDVVKMFLDAGYTIYEVDNFTYKNTRQRIRIICEKHNDMEIFMSVDGLRANQECKHCSIEKRSQENHYRWSGGKDAYDDKYRNSNEYSEWRLAVFKRDNYICQCCKLTGLKLNAHHIFNFATHKDIRYDIENGITMCEECHRRFHKVYGVFKNNKEQIDNFLRTEGEM
ncbi:HNH endonuclease [Klebsiella pneumoniae]|nr:HNH endonuclease [Klebsiella pneumoniae]MDS7714302.1 HNH endonuclease [Klebsiella pneumoniae]